MIAVRTQASRCINNSLRRVARKLGEEILSTHSIESKYCFGLSLILEVTALMGIVFSLLLGHSLDKQHFGSSLIFLKSFQGFHCSSILQIALIFEGFGVVKE